MRQIISTSAVSLLALLLGLVAVQTSALAIGSDDPQQRGVDWPPAVTPATAAVAKGYIAEMKTNKRGPFWRLRWFCKDGTILPPRPYKCDQHGGSGVQHGQWSNDTIAVRNGGWLIGNLLVEVDADDVIGSEDKRQYLNSLLLEKFLVAYDDGWILRQARFYRGGFQLEDEVAGGDRVLQGLLSDQDYLNQRYLMIREVARLLPHSAKVDSLTKVRGMATNIEERDDGFRGLRGKIHGQPDALDAQRVREYASTSGKNSLQPDYEALAAAIDTAYSLDNLSQEIINLSGSGELNRAADQLKIAQTPMARFQANAAVLKLLRNELQTFAVSKRQKVLNVSLRAEQAAFAAGQAILGGQDQPTQLNRAERVQILAIAAEAVYGAGLISLPELNEVVKVTQNTGSGSAPLAQYRRSLKQLERVPGWASTRLQYFLGGTIEHWSEIEPLAEQYIPDRLRASSLLLYSRVIDGLLADANSKAGLQHELFDSQVGAGLRSLNPGLARGRLVTGVDHSSDTTKQIVLVPETIAELPAVAGILTSSEGNALSHVQLLARNLGVPNVVVSDQWLDTLKQYEGQDIVVASSPAGVVQISPDGNQWDAIFQVAEEGTKQAMVLNVGKLDLTQQKFLPMLDLRATDSGVVAGPKAAKLGELGYRFPGQVSAGLVIPFGTYRDLLSQPSPVQDLTMFEWMQTRYSVLEQLKQNNPEQYRENLNEFLAYMRNWFMQVPLSDVFINTLRADMQAVFGTEGQYGVFVRSDTNVEDLPNFSGAGLNLTVHHVVGFDETIEAIRRVWASPFTERAFSWRQALVDQPEHVYASVLLHKSVPAEKSGVMVTQDLDTGSSSVATVVMNEGVGGGVDGQRAEQIKINLETGEVTRLSSALASQKRILLNTGGSQLVRAGSPADIISPAEREQLRQLALKLPSQFPELRDATGQLQAADVEFGFKDGKLWLFQIRPFVENDTASGNAYLMQLERGLLSSDQQTIDMSAIP